MRRDGIIKWMSEDRKVFSEKSQKEFHFREFEMEWEESERNCDSYKQRLVMTCEGVFNEDLIQLYIKDQTVVNFTFYLDSREWNQKKFTNIRGFLPKILLLDERPF